MSERWDAIVVGARCAGSPTAMHLARRGHRVLLVDRATFPSDTVSTHLLHPVAVALLRRWGLLDRLVATGCPPIHTYVVDFGPFTLSGSPGTPDAPVAYCPRRTVLDELLVRAAADAGAEVREGFTVDALVVEGGRVTGVKGRSRSGAAVVERAEVVVGADGRHSLVAREVRAPAYDEKEPLLCAYYSYWSGLPMGGRFEQYVRPYRGCAATPTHGGLTLVIAGWPQREFEARRHDVERSYLETLALVPELAARMRGARREERISGASVPNYFRRPYGPGWALVGDAGYNKDFITAQGIQDAFRDAERCAGALHESLAGERPFDAAMADHHRERDAHVRSMYEFTCDVARLEPPAPEVERLLAAIAGRQPAMDRYAQMNAGTISPAEFFAPESVAAMLAGAHGAGAAPAPA
jgi:2-polyprenyl-6-methoxyphenol hydroxylase-like FAD-dependent oxidoreductase